MTEINQYRTIKFAKGVEKKLSKKLKICGNIRPIVGNSVIGKNKLVESV